MAVARDGVCYRNVTVVQNLNNGHDILEKLSMNEECHFRFIFAIKTMA